MSVAIPVPKPEPIPLPMVQLFVPDRSIYWAGREWSGTEIVILSERLPNFVTRKWG